jgi:beta-phosphoglucomutase family hydrolase
MSGPTVLIHRSAIDAVVFDMDGVVTRTATVHATAWAALFDAYLQAVADRGGARYRAFTQDDYLRFVDGKPRYDGVRDFLASRGLSLPWGDPSDSPDALTVCGLGNRKDACFRRLIAEQGVQSFPGAVALTAKLKQAGIRVAIISASTNMSQILEAAGVQGLFEAELDGEVAAELGLPGKPDPAVFVEAARRLGAMPDRAVVVEDAIAGVEAGRRGAFALVIGVDGGGNREALAVAGADVVVADLGEVELGD